MLVSHALAYVTASKNGVSEPEIEDFISLDDKVGESKTVHIQVLSIFLIDIKCTFVYRGRIYKNFLLFQFQVQFFCFLVLLFCKSDP